MKLRIKSLEWKTVNDGLLQARVLGMMYHLVIDDKQKKPIKVETAGVVVYRGKSKFEGMRAANEDARSKIIATLIVPRMYRQ